jgi:hypothetical protein
LKILLLIVTLLFQFFVFGQENRGIKLTPLFNGSPLELDKNYILEDSSWYKFSTCRFYLSNLSFFKDGKLKEKVNEFYLFDLEDPLSFSITFKNQDFDSFSFNIGIDSTTNVSGILDGTLDPINGMYWAWNSGYINFKLEGTSSESTEKNKSFEFHLGGYLAPYQTIQTVSLPIEKNSNDILISFDLYPFIKGIDLNKSSNVMIPGINAVKLSALLPSLFTIL